MFENVLKVHYLPHGVYMPLGEGDVASIRVTARKGLRLQWEAHEYTHTFYFLHAHPLEGLPCPVASLRK